MYAFVDVKDYQKVVVTDSSKGIEVAAANYLGDAKVIDEDKVVTNRITINSIKSVVIDGNTYYYIVDEDNNKFKVSIKVSKDILPFLNSGDSIKATYEEKDVSEIVKLEK